jgi:hypothetical protein
MTHRRVAGRVDREAEPGPGDTGSSSSAGCGCWTRDARQTAAYSDPRYVPFYSPPRGLGEAEGRAGDRVPAGPFDCLCRARGAGRRSGYLGFQQRTDSYYSDRLGRANVRDHFKGPLDVYQSGVSRMRLSSRGCPPAKWDLVIVNEEERYDAHVAYLDTVWPHVADDGLGGDGLRRPPRSGGPGVSGLLPGEKPAGGRGRHPVRRRDHPKITRGERNIGL